MLSLQIGLQRHHQRSARREHLVKDKFRCLLFLLVVLFALPWLLENPTPDSERPPLVAQLDDGDQRFRLDVLCFIEVEANVVAAVLLLGKFPQAFPK